MYLAPVSLVDPAALVAQVQPLASGVAGVAQTLRAMRDAVTLARRDPIIRGAALSIIANAPPRDDWSEAASLFHWVRDCVRYVRDVHEVETLAYPGVTVRTLVGDCDDQVTLLAALAESVGIPSRFVLLAHQTPGELDHVCVELLANGEWVGCDPTEAQPFGWLPEALTVAREHVGA